LPIFGGGAFESKPLDEDGAGVGGDGAADAFGAFQALGRGVLNHVGQSGLFVWTFERTTGAEAWNRCLVRSLAGVGKFEESD